MLRSKLSLLLTLTNLLWTSPSAAQNSPPLPIKKSQALKPICAKDLSDINSKPDLKKNLGKLLYRDQAELQAGDAINFGSKKTDDMVLSLDRCCEFKEHVNPKSVFKLIVSHEGQLQVELGGKVGTGKVSEICSNGETIDLKFSYPYRVFVTSELKHVESDPLNFSARLKKSNDNQFKLASSIRIDKKNFRYSDSDLEIIKTSEESSTQTQPAPKAVGFR